MKQNIAYSGSLHEKKMSAMETHIRNGNKVKQNGTSSHCRIKNLFKTSKNETMNIIGRLTRDAEVRTLQSEKQVVNFSVATNDSYKNKQGERIEQTTYFDCSYWITPNVAKLLTKGTLVELTGRVSARAWTGSDGESKAGLNFHTSQIKLHGGGKRAESLQAPTETESTKVTAPVLEDLPF
jgi:single-strand DNA-binding protein